jgi:hypothetical protein
MKSRTLDWKAEPENASSDESRRPGSKVKLEDAVAGASWRSGPKANRKADRRRKPVVGKKVQPKDATDDEGLEVGPKVKPEAAVFDESRKLICRGSVGCSSERSWRLAAGTAEGLMDDESRTLIGRHSRRTRVPTEAGVGRK